MCCPSWPRRKKFLLASILLFVAAVGFLITSIVFPILVDKLIDKGITEQTIMTSPDSKFFKEIWQLNSADNPTTVPIFRQFYVWNITNVNEVLKGQTPIKLQQVGPYVYRINQVRYNISFKDDGNVLDHWTWTYYTYEKNLSGGRDPKRDMVTLPNFAFIGVALKFQKASILNLLADFLVKINGETFLTKQSAHGFIWGYDSQLLKLLSTLARAVGIIVESSVPGITTNYTDIGDSYRRTGQNSILTGKNDTDLVLQFTKWNGTKAITGVYAEPEPITGTEGTLFKRSLKKSDVLKVWVQDSKRMNELVYVKESEHKGISLYQFALTPTTFLNASLHASNRHYFQLGPSGVGNLTSDYNGIPIFYGKPHFLDADPIYTKYIQGMNPVREDHETIVNVEPISGVTMLGFKRYQINVKLLDIPLTSFAGIPEVLCPYVWLEDKGEVTDKLADDFRNSVYVGLGAAYVIKWISVTFTIVCALAGIATLVYVYYFRGGEEPESNKHMELL